MEPRKFEEVLAVRKRTWLRIAFCGPTGSGKSLSSQLVARGLADVDGSQVTLVNTEGANGMMYAPRPGESPIPPKTFGFKHIPFDPPYRSLDYLAAMEHAVKAGAGVVIVDQGSFEHEGEGGYLDFHERELDRMAPAGATEAVRSKYWGAWIKPGAERHHMLMRMQLLPAHIIWCFRAKEKLKIISGKPPVDLGWQAIAGDEVLAEFPLRLLLPPGADGIPNLRPEMPGEKLFNRVQIHLRGADFLKEGAPIDIELGRKLGRWAAGAASVPISTQAVREANEVIARVLGEVKARFPGTAGATARRQSLLDHWKVSAPEGLWTLSMDTLELGLEAFGARKTLDEYLDELEAQRQLERETIDAGREPGEE